MVTNSARTSVAESARATWSAKVLSLPLLQLIHAWDVIATRLWRTSGHRSLGGDHLDLRDDRVEPPGGVALSLLSDPFVGVAAFQPSRGDRSVDRSGKVGHP